MRESCGVFGVYAPNEDVARLTFFALFALQHRGQESAGIATADGKKLNIHARMGLVSQVFNEESLSHLGGHIAIGHNRYSTRGSSREYNVQPIVVGKGSDSIAVAHNGNIVNAETLHEELCEQGYVFHTSTDTEVIANLILASPEKNWVDKIRYAMRRLQGAYSLTILIKDALFGVRGTLGVRPLCLGSIDNGWVIASESCALDHIGAHFIREIEPGEIVSITENGIDSHRERVGRRALCIFEYIYFARPDSVINGRLLYPARQAMGAMLAQDHPVAADLVMGVPDSAISAGVGYSQQSGIPLGEGLIKNRYVGRTFIEPDQRIRDLGVKLKFNPLPQMLDDKRLVVVDDSIVRGTTTPSVVKMLRRALCIFEYIYFARPDSVINSRLLYPARQAMGAMLAQDYPVSADLVMGVPDSAISAGVGYSQQSGIPLGEGLIKNRYVGRTFIEPDQRIRDLGVKLKFNPLPQMLDGKRLVVVDDSIVRGTTTPSVVKMLRRAGATEVHMRICAPPIRYPCFFGVDMATRRELIAAQKTVPEIRDFIGADSLGYQSIKGLIEAVALPKDTFCLACFTGDYPIPIQLEMDKLALEAMPVGHEAPFDINQR